MHIRRFLSRGKNFIRRSLRKAPIKRDYRALAPVIAEMARSGAGTDDCLEFGCLPLPIHYYSPVPDIKDLEDRQIWDRRSKLGGIDFRPQFQTSFLTQLGKEYGAECHWPLKSTADPLQFYCDNGRFSFGCAAALYSILRHFKPAHIIEVGAGMSSLVISQALQVNKNDTSGYECEYTIIEPYPMDILVKGIPHASHLLQSRIETMDPAFFDQLKANDVLFIDSSHVVRTGGDVNYLILDVLPRLAPGVVIHFHDIHLPYEYHKIYFTNPSFRVFWTEAYLLQAFLSFNSQFEILMGLWYLMTDHNSAFQSAFPYYNPQEISAVSSSFWIRRIQASA